MAAWSGLNDLELGGAYSLPTEYRFPKGGVARMFRSLGSLEFQEILDTILGAASGSAASKTYSQIGGKEVGGALGGVRTINTVTVISRNTTDADVTDAKAVMQGLKVSGLTRVNDAAGNSVGRVAGWNPTSNWGR
jgi:hypothetical protein